MAARTRRGTAETGWDETVREKIRSSMLINRLLSHALGECQMEPTQVRAAEILLRKTLPDLTASENTTEVTHNYVVRMPAKVENIDEWKQRYLPQPTIQ